MAYTICGPRYNLKTVFIRLGPFTVTFELLTSKTCRCCERYESEIYILTNCEDTCKLSVVTMAFRLEVMAQFKAFCGLTTFIFDL